MHTHTHTQTLGAQSGSTFDGQTHTKLYSSCTYGIIQTTANERCQMTVQACGCVHANVRVCERLATTARMDWWANACVLHRLEKQVS
jgi:hypothetical protein